MSIKKPVCSFVIMDLSPFLCMGRTIAYLNLSGNTPVTRERLNMKVNSLLISCAQCFKILLGIPSYPDEFFF